MDEILSFFLITILVISGIGVGLWSFFTGLTTVYNATLSEPVGADETELIRNINYTQKITEDITNPLKEQLTKTREKNILSNIADVFIGGVVTAVLFFINIPDIVITFISTLTAPLAWVVGEDSWVYTMINSIIALIIVLVIIRVIMKWKF